MKLYRLRCFRCGKKFKYGNDVFRDSDNYPVCETCLCEILSETWDDDYTEYILSEIKKKFNRKYNKWSKWFHKNNDLCEGEHEDYDFYYEEKKHLTIIDGKKYCRLCIDKMNDNLI